MLAMLLLAALPQDPLPFDEALLEPHLPGAEWTALAPDDIQRQGAFARFGDAYNGEPAENWLSSRLARSYTALVPGSEAPTLFEVRSAIEALRGRVAASPAFEDANGPLLRRSLLLELDGVLSQLGPRTERDALPLDWETAKTFVSARFGRETVPLVVDDKRYVTDTLFFPGEPTQVVLRLDEQPPIGASTPLAYYATLEQAIEFRAAARSMVMIFGDLVQPQLERTARSLHEIDGRWTNYLEHGFSQYPWESWANGWLTDFSWSRPPRSQWVLLHPELGFVFDTRSTRSAEMQAALLVHGVGYVRYFSDNEWFLGLSATASITNDRAYGMGFGPTLHFGHTRLASRVPHVSVGVMWQDFEVGGREPVLAATLDLWRLVDRGSEALYEARLLRR